MLPAAEISVRETNGETWARVTDQQVRGPLRLSAQVGNVLEISLGCSSVGMYGAKMGVGYKDCFLG